MPKRKRGVAGDAACRQQAIMKRERRVDETDEERNRRFSIMAKSGQDRRNAVGREKPKKQKNKQIADCQTWHNVARREETKKAEEQRKSRLVRQNVSRDLKE
ncbi:hypothetical protein AVEN_230589-1 [Araneus ventricosus]|uniref:Uncharacterized protein n=1 Tax=Araneus ventricosus TaxID=182803 RepID=A0A4Y2MRE0_ARAVE|nr:hypothetical protein AVEN_230589-1 [Araneus ventricosus]